MKEGYSIQVVEDTNTELSVLISGSYLVVFVARAHARDFPWDHLIGQNTWAEVFPST